jgi:uncharacterized protein
MDHTLTDNAEHSRYELRVGDALAFVSYRRAPGVTTLTFAKVPEQLAGRGIGAALARAVLEAVRARGDRVIPTCGFIAAFIARHPEFHGLLVTAPRAAPPPDRG